VNKQELVKEIAAKTSLSMKAANDVLDTFTTSITNALKKGGRVNLIGFGSFEVKKRAARKGRNPKTGEAIKIKARNVAKFSAGKGLKDAVNKAK
jgi:DNA-binding protein HU-beta